MSLISTEPVGPRERRLAVGAALISTVVGLAMAPFAQVQVAHLPAFIPIYVSALVICDLVTAALVLGQFAACRSQALLVLAAGYVFNAATTVAYAVVFPGVFSTSGLLGAGSQTTSALYMFWHGMFPLTVIGYVVLSRREDLRAIQRRTGTGRAVLTMVAGVFAAVLAFAWFATAMHDHLPVFLDGDRTTPSGRLALAALWLLSLAALSMLWRKKPRAVLDLSLMVVMVVWLIDIGLAAVVNSGRYDLGWYAGRIYGLLGASALLLFLLVENSRQYATMIRMTADLRTANQSLEQLSNSDALSGLANRRHFDAYLGEQIGIARRHGRPLALVLCDIDRFKSYNDRHGHQAGDRCLHQVARAIRACCQRPADLAARYGGEEFAMILPDTDLRGAAHMAEAARRAVETLGILAEPSVLGPFITVSCGVAELRAHGSSTAHELIAAADGALYTAKQAGRNRVVLQPLGPTLANPSAQGA